MEAASKPVVITLTRDEAVELFMRCLRSQDDDTDMSVSILRKLASKLKGDGEEYADVHPIAIAA